MKSKILELEDNKIVLERRYISNTENSWMDDVQKSFFSKHIEPLRAEYDNIFAVMDHTANVFIEGEKNIKSLL